ncbi:hypothetical protein BC938DRAFT_470646, partial [Jimgerdemannia flammicorona]
EQRRLLQSFGERPKATSRSTSPEQSKPVAILYQTIMEWGPIGARAIVNGPPYTRLWLRCLTTCPHKVEIRSTPSADALKLVAIFMRAKLERCAVNPGDIANNTNTCQSSTPPANSAFRCQDNAKPAELLLYSKVNLR